MAELGERRKGRRVKLPERPGGRIRATLSARLLDLSTTGARIEHHNMLRPGFTCTLCGDCLASCRQRSIAYRFPGLPAEAARRLFLVLVVSLHAVFLGVARM